MGVDRRVDCAARSRAATAAKGREPPAGGCRAQTLTGGLLREMGVGSLATELWAAPSLVLLVCGTGGASLSGGEPTGRTDWVAASLLEAGGSLCTSAAVASIPALGSTKSAIAPVTTQSAIASGITAKVVAAAAAAAIESLSSAPVVPSLSSDEALTAQAVEASELL